MWPQQHAETIPGHRLRSNEYVLVRIIDEEEAKANWQSAVITPIEGEDAPESLVETNRATGQLLIIKGIEASFYIPPTGAEVVGYEDDKTGDYQYIRQACTLENLEYCILIDENGNKRYETGPQVVFPEPTEQFWRDAQGMRKFKAIELNDIQGIHVKVVADYTEDGEDYKAGDELWLKGGDAPIYIPRAEHAMITYGDGTKVHYGTTVPEGEGRYVLNRQNGIISTEQGPKVLLPDPRTEVMVRRTLSDSQSDLWYPGNADSLAYNRQLRQVEEEAGTQERGAMAESTYRSSTRRLASSVQVGATTEMMGAVADAGFEDVGSAGIQNVGFERGTDYTKPRTLTLDTRFDGVPRICPWTGFAVQITGADGNRKVTEGPATILLDYDQTLEVLHLSKGSPKQSDDRLATVYLRTRNNKVSDVIQVLTADHIPIELRVSFLIDFDPAVKDTWFDVEDYVKLLTDHARSVLKGRIRKIPVQEFYEKSTDVVRDICLGESKLQEPEEEGDEPKHARPLMRFKENGMIVKDVDVLNVKIEDDGIRELLEDAQRDTISSHIQVQRAEEQLSATKKTQKLDRESQIERHKTIELNGELQQKRIKLDLVSALETIAAEIAEATQKEAANVANEKATDVSHTATIERKQAAHKQQQGEDAAIAELDKLILEAKTKSTVDTFGAAKDGMGEIAIALSNHDTLIQVSKALSLQNAIGGGDMVDTLRLAFEGTGLASVFEKLASTVKSRGVSLVESGVGGEDEGY